MAKRLRLGLAAAIAIALLGGQAPLDAAAQVPPVPPPPPAGHVYNNHLLPQRNAGSKNLLVFVHGWRDNATMWNGLDAAITAWGLPADWDVWNYDWNQDASPWRFDRAVSNTGPQGQNLAHQIVTKGQIGGVGGYERVHFISHSLGAGPQEFATWWLRRQGITVQQTFLDPALPGMWLGQFGARAPAESYFNREGVPFTDLPMARAYNVDVSAMSPYGWWQPQAGHKWPVEWYERGIPGVGGVPQSTYNNPGWGLSLPLALKGAQGWPPLEHTANVGKVRVLNAAGGIASTRYLALVDEARNTHLAMVSTAGDVTLSADAGGNVHGFAMSADSSQAASLVLNLNTIGSGGIVNPGVVNAMFFDYELFSTPLLSPREGVLEIHIVDRTGDDWQPMHFIYEEFNLETGLQEGGPISLMRSLPEGEWGLAFTWHSLDGLPTSIAVDNIAFGYTVPEPGGVFMAMACLGLGLRRRRQALVLG